MTIDGKLKNLIQRELVVFDFDETLVDCNSDSWIHKLAPGGKIPDELEYRHGQDYFKHVQAVITYLHQNGVTRKDYVDCLSKMPPVSGMFDTLIETLGRLKDQFDMIILSDSNSFFISSYLKSKQCEDLFSTVLTNSAIFCEDGSLKVEEYHIQDHCSISARNLCKGEALKNFIGRRMLDHNTVYKCVNYVGDGENDLCPCTKLNSRDRIFPREGYSLDRLCTKLKNNSPDVRRLVENNKLPELKATVTQWNSGSDILNKILDTETII